MATTAEWACGAGDSQTASPKDTREPSAYACWHSPVAAVTFSSIDAGMRAKATVPRTLPWSSASGYVLSVTSKIATAGCPWPWTLP